jgi:hypothetical protein
MERRQRRYVRARACRSTGDVGKINSEPIEKLSKSLEIVGGKLRFTTITLVED